MSSWASVVQVPKLLHGTSTVIEAFITRNNIKSLLYRSVN
jgi:hypothetical protein